MDPQPSPSPTPAPTTPSPVTPTPINFAPPPGNKNKNLLLWALVAFLGLGAIIFAILTIYAFNQAHITQTAINQQVKSAVTTARDDQKKQDAQAAEIADESPFRSYIAPIAFGSFEIKFPKNWDGSVDEEQASGTQVTLLMHPDFIRKSTGVDQLAAAKVQLIQKPLNAYIQQFQNVKDMKRSDTTVSGINAVQFVGKFPDRRTIKAIVVPIRDKVLVFSTEDAAYDSEFNQILAQSKVLP